MLNTYDRIDRYIDADNNIMDDFHSFPSKDEIISQKDLLEAKKNLNKISDKKSKTARVALTHGASFIITQPKF